MEKYDVIIIGAGPAGSSAAIFLSKTFDRILLVDKSVFPREKLCGGALSAKTIQLLEEGVGLDNRFEDLLTEFHSSSMYYQYSEKRSFDLSEHPIYFVRRIEFDEYLLRKAEDRGVEVREGTRVTAVNSKIGVVTLDGDEKVAADILVGADGFPSMVARHVKRDMNTSFREHAMAYEVHIPRNRVPEELLAEPVLYIGDVTAGYGWVFPKKEVVTVGLAGIKGRNPRLREQFTEFIEFLKIPREDLPRVQGHWVPSSVMDDDIVFNRCFLVGDAAKFADPLIGEGIYYAILSSKLLSESLMEYDGTSRSLRSVAENYKKKCQRQIGMQFKYAFRIRELIARDAVLKKCMEILDVDREIAHDLILMMNGHMSFRKFWFKSWIRSPIFVTKLLLNSMRRRGKVVPKSVP